MVAHGGADLGWFVSTHFPVSGLRSLELDPLLGDIIADNKVISCGNIAASGAIFLSVTSLPFPDSSFSVADRRFNVKGSDTTVPEVGVIDIPAINPDSIEADRIN